MKDMESLLLRLVALEVRGEEPEEALSECCRSLTAEEWQSLYDLAKHQDLAHLVGDLALRSGWLPEGEIRQKFQKKTFLAVSRYRVIDHELSRVSALFEEEKIPYIPLKGSVLRGHYREPWFRTSCDIDLLVKEEDLNLALAALQNRLGYAAEAKGPHDVGTTAPSGVRLELHYRLSEEGREEGASEAPLADVFSSASPCEAGAFRLSLAPEVFYYYHVYHTAKHFQNGGCGVRPFLDFFVMRSIPCPEDKKRNLLARGGLTAFADACEHLTSVWLCGETPDALTARMEEYLLAGGTYGNLANKAQVGFAKKGGKIRFLLSRIFLPYRELRYRYPKLEKHPWLLPFYEVFRWFDRLFSGRWKRGAAEFSALTKTDGRSGREVQAMLSELGLSSGNDSLKP